jgi:hypothetical protein
MAGGGTSNVLGGYNPEQAAREAAGSNSSSTGTTKTTVNEPKIDSPYLLKYNSETGQVLGQDSTSKVDLPGALAILADPSNRQKIALTNEGMPYDILNYLNTWALKNANKDAIGEMRTKLVAKGYLQGDAAKQSLQAGNVPDQYLLQALGSAVGEVSRRNYFLQGKGGYVTLEEGIDGLSIIPDKTSGTGNGGTYRDVNRRIFQKADYRTQVDDAYRSITGQAADEGTLSTFVKMLQHMENKNPEVTTRVVSGKNSTSTTKGGVSAEAAQSLLLEQALKDPSAEGHTKAGTFMGYFMNAIKENAQ